MGRVSDAKPRLMEAIRELIWSGSYGSTTIDLICEKAGVKKGSFYYFYESKADLALDAINEEWERRRGELDSIFSPTVPPLERLERYLEYGYGLQEQIRQKCGCVLGCPLLSLGAEVSTQEHRLQKRIQEILDEKRMYLESAIRDAKAAGLIRVPDPARKARMLFSYYQGLLAQARIQNDMRILAEAKLGTLELLGVEQGEMVTI